MMDEEEREDTELRSRFKEKWTRQPSATLAENLRKEVPSSSSSPFLLVSLSLSLSIYIYLSSLSISQPSLSPSPCCLSLSLSIPPPSLSLSIPPPSLSLSIFLPFLSLSLSPSPLHPSLSLSLSLSISLPSFSPSLSLHQVNKYKTILDTASGADATVRQKFESHKEAIVLLGKPVTEIQVALPKAGALSPRVQGSQV